MIYYKSIIYVRTMKARYILIKKGEESMNELQMKKEAIISKLKEVNEQLTDEIIENATKEELEQYIDLVDSITARLETLDLLEENN